MRSLITTAFLCFVLSATAQTPNWPAIKNKANPMVHDTANYGTPYIQPHHNIGWEDGMFISRDGLHMYAFYFPADLILFSNYLSQNPICPPIHPFIRGPLLGIDTVTNPFGCNSLLHSDIIYATRADTSQPFANWQPSNLANAVEFEGAPQTIARTDGSVEFLVYTQSDNSQTDIYWFRDTVNNPTGPGTLMPAPVNSPNTYEDNPHLERINDSTLVLFLDDHADPAADAYIYYSVSTDDGTTWTPKSLVTSVNSAEENIQPHLWTDGIDWWLYFVANDPNDPSNRLSIFRMRQGTPGDWDSWVERELVISPGLIDDDSGFPAAVGEPSLTAWGDISFVLVIQALGTTDPNDQFEIDPWYLPRKTSPFTSTPKVQPIENTVEIFPNPASDQVMITTGQPGTLDVYSALGQRVMTGVRLLEGSNQLDLNLPPQLYVFVIRNQSSQTVQKVIVR